MLCLQIVLTQSVQPFLNDGCFASLFKIYRFSTNTHIFSSATHLLHAVSATIAYHYRQRIVDLLFVLINHTYKTMEEWGRMRRMVLLLPGGYHPATFLLFCCRHVAGVSNVYAGR